MQKSIKISLLTIIFIAIIAVSLLMIRNHALSDEQLLNRWWKVYSSCSSDVMILKPDDLEKIGKQWEISYRWYNNTVFLHVKDDPRSADCVYIGK